MVKFRKKPVEIEAIQYNGPFTLDEMRETWGDAFKPIVVSLDGRAGVVCGLAIETLEGTMKAEPLDWIIRGVKGEFYPCKPDIFSATYEPV